MLKDTPTYSLVTMNLKMKRQHKVKSPKTCAIVLYPTA